MPQAAPLGSHKPSGSGQMQHEIVFIVDDARLEAQAMLLAATLQDHCRHSARLVAYAPRSRLAGLSPLTLAVLAACDVELRGFAARPRLWARPYPHGNKLIACSLAEARAAPEVRRITFMDTDMIVRADFAADLPLNDKVLVVPEGKPTWGKAKGDWLRAYGAFGLPLPEERVLLTRGRRKSVLPYFNAGLVSFPAGPDGAPGKGFALAWRETASRLDRSPIADKRPWLDQISLPVTLYRGGFGWAALDERFNFSLSERAGAGIPEDTRVLHYHRGSYLADFPAEMEAAMLSALDRLRPRDRGAFLGFLEHHIVFGLDAAETGPAA